VVYDLSNDSKQHVHDIPCGKCELCRVNYRYEKALRIMLESKEHEHGASFITLTFNNENHSNPDLDHREWSQFIKNFRQAFCQTKYCDISKPQHWKSYGKVRSHTHKEIRQVMCGEYGDTFGRKHFHGIIFNHSFSDMLFTGDYSKKGNPIYTSPALAQIWKKGRVQVDPLTFDLALYVGSYVTDAQLENAGHSKKQYGLFGRGIGASWISRHWRDVLSANKVMMLDKDYPIPRYFKKWIEKNQPTAYAAYKLKNFIASQEQRDRTISKGYGPLARAQAKGRIFNQVQRKRKTDGIT